MAKTNGSVMSEESKQLHRALRQATSNEQRDLIQAQIADMQKRVRRQKQEEKKAENAAARAVRREDKKRQHREEVLARRAAKGWIDTTSMSEEEKRVWELHRGVYHAMKFRCYSDKCSQYKDYGGRGIRVCDRWLENFLHFIEDMGFRPEGDYQLDRIDNDGNYEPGNCRWVTRVENMKNQRKERAVYGSVTRTEKERKWWKASYYRGEYRKQIRKAALLPVAPHVEAILQHYR